MDVLCFDMGSSGVRGARFDERLRVSALHSSPWNLQRDQEGRATLSVYDVECAFLEVAHALAGPTAPAAASIACFMHSYLVLSSCCAALTPVFTWMDTSEREGVERIQRHLGHRFHERTGCHYYPMFPVFKLAANPPGRGNRVGSPKSWLAWELTGEFVEDYGMASASGLLNVQSGTWDAELVRLVDLDVEDLPRVVDPFAMVGTVSDAGALRFGIPAGTKLVSGSGDGFVANIGSGCTTPRQTAVTLGTSGAVRQMLSSPVLDPAAGTFCYRASSDNFLLGCATNNGGNVLEWARETFAETLPDVADGVALPIFLPFLNGERSVEWNPDLHEAWFGRLETHTTKELARAVTEGVVFNLAQYVEIVERQSGSVARDVVLSGNGFQDGSIARLLASLLGRDLAMPKSAGLATLRGAAIYAWQALGHDVRDDLQKYLDDAPRVCCEKDAALLERFAKFKHLRRHLKQTT
jgi:gluconokinase